MTTRFDRPSLQGLLVIGFALLGALTPARAATEIDTPLADTPDASASGPTLEAQRAIAGGATTIPRLAPMSAARFAALKAAAAQNPAAQPASPARSAAAGPEPALADLVTSFTGLDRPSAASNGFVFFPPDTIVAKSFARVLEATNSAIRLFTTAGGVLATSNLNAFFSAPVADGLLFDPKVYFDRNAANRRFYVVALQASGTVSKIWLAVSRSSDPANLSSASWCRYAIDARRNVGTPDASFADYPGLGAGADKLVVSVNNFRFVGETFTFAIIRAWNKLILANNAAACPSVPRFTFQATAGINNGSVFTLQPVQHYSSPSVVPSAVGNTSPAYLINTQFGASTLYRVWRIAGLPGVTGGVLQLVNVFGSFVYGVQPNAPQTGTDVLIDTGDNRVTQAGGRGNFLTAVHGTLCNLGGGANESCVRTVRIFVSSSGNNPTAFVNQQSTFGFSNEFYFWPAVAVNGLSQTIVPFQFISPVRTGGRLSTWFTAKDSPTPFFTSILNLTTGSCAQTLTGRSGDYNGAQTDPSDDRTFWIAGERATLIGGECQWQTRIGRIDPGFNVDGFQPE
jgi:hypothetical protein